MPYDKCKRVLNISSDMILYEDPDFPMRDSDDNLIDEMSQEFLEVNDDDMIGECSQAFIESSQFFQRLPLYYQVGSGFENRPGPSTSGPAYVEGIVPVSGNLEDALVLEERFRRRNNKYQAEEISFRALVDPERLPRHMRDAPMSAVVEAVRQLFQILIRSVSQGLRSTDLIRFCIQADGLDKPISTRLMPVSELTTEKVLAATMKVLQSKDEIKLDTGFRVDITIIQREVGAGLNRKVLNAEKNRLNKTSILSIPTDEKGLCCAKAIVYALAHLDQDKQAINALRDRRRPALLNRAVKLHEAAGVPLGPCTYSQISIFEQHLNVQIVVFSLENFNKMSYKGPNRAKRINLWLNHSHYDVIKSLKGFYGSKFYCENCEKPFQRIEDHCCTIACNVCRRVECPSGQPQRCQDCDRLCKSQDCFDVHKAVTGQQQFSICDRIYQCRVCCKVIRRRDCPRENHRCGTMKCPSCDQFVSTEDHRCYLRIVSPKKPSDRLIFFDFETDQSSGEHVVNFAVAQYADGGEKIFKGYSACTDFCDWLFAPKHKGFTAIAHNMKGFDGQFIMAWLLAQGIAPEVIPNGSMVMAIYHKALNVRIIDSLNFLPMALAKLPACFGFTELKKGYFPHLFNLRENQKYVGSLPDPKYYSPDTMGSATRAAFFTWHKEHENDVFDFEQEMLAYCRSDVDILRRCCLEFRAQFMEVADVDPFCYVTIASACMAVYRSNHIQSDTVAMIPVQGYVNRTNYSPDSIRWLDFVAFTQGIQIQHALNSNGEHKIAGISVDGFCHETQTVYQYHGCFYHGCSTCYDGDVLHPFKRVPMATLRKKTEDTTMKLRAQGFNILEMWEHDFLKQKRTNEDLKTFIETHAVKDRLNPRDAFFGGRTNAIKLYYEGAAKYVDFTSLYPWVNKYCTYPVGHPTIITEEFGNVQDYFGIIHCRVIPPRRLYLPVLPYRSQGKLMFPLCRVCVEKMQQSSCNHTDEERALIGTWVTEEIKLALKKGYHITHIYEVYHFESSSDSLFRSYIDLFLKIKQESSGWPSDCTTVEEKSNYIRQYKEKEGISLNAACITKNSGRRQVAKLALNSFWGRWGMNINKGQLTFINSLSKFNKMLVDSTKNLKDIYFPTSEVAAIQWEKASDFVLQDASTNIFIAAFTTAWARLKLYEEMDKLGRDVLYHDTDSIIYAQNGGNDPPLGNFLGEFTDELDGDVITTFVSGGPKNYGYQTAAGKTCCKVRGFTLNFRNSQLLNFDTIKNMVCDMDQVPLPIYNSSKICREAKKRKVINKPETKLYKIVYDKRVIQSDLSTLPYGY